MEEVTGSSPVGSTISIIEMLRKGVAPTDNATDNT